MKTPARFISGIGCVIQACVFEYPFQDLTVIVIHWVLFSDTWYQCFIFSSIYITRYVIWDTRSQELLKLRSFFVAINEIVISIFLQFISISFHDMKWKWILRYFHNMFHITNLKNDMKFIKCNVIQLEHKTFYFPVLLTPWNTCKYDTLYETLLHRFRISVKNSVCSIHKKC